MILDGDGQVLAKSEEAQDGSPGQQPAEYLALDVDDPIVYAAVYAYDIDQPATFDIFAAGPGVEVVEPCLPTASPHLATRRPRSRSELLRGLMSTLEYYSSGPDQRWTTEA